MKTNPSKKRRGAAKKETRDQFLLRTLMENIPVHVYFKDRDSRFIAVSESKARRDGIDSAAMAGKTDFDLFSDKHAARRSRTNSASSRPASR